MSFSNLLWGLFFSIITFCIYSNIGVHGASSQYIEITNFIFHVSVCISIHSGGVSIPYIFQIDLFLAIEWAYLTLKMELFQFSLK